MLCAALEIVCVANVHADRVKVQGLWTTSMGAQGSPENDACYGDGDHGRKDTLRSAFADESKANRVT